MRAFSYRLSGVHRAVGRLIPSQREGNQILFIVDAVAALLNRTLFVLVSTVRKLDTYWLYFVASNANL